MKWIKSLFIGLVLFGTVDSCIKEPTYNTTPYIELQDLIFRRGDLTKLIQDSLIFRIKFRDGDGDLGVGPEDTSSVDYHNPYYWAYDSNTNYAAYSVRNTQLPAQTNKWVTYKDKTKFGLPDINCSNWEQLKNNEVPPKVIDTVYITQNLKAFNINVDVYFKSATDTSYVLLDPGDYFSFPGCSPNLFRATFPDLSTDRLTSPLEGTITFWIQSFGLYQMLSTHTLKMEITINDRAFHTSNSIIKKGFTLKQITK